MSDEREIEKLLRRTTTVWLKAIDGMLVDMHTGDVLGPCALDGFGYKLPKRRGRQERDSE